MTKEVYGMCQWPNGLPGWGSCSDEKIRTCPHRVIGSEAKISPGTTFHLLAISNPILIKNAWLYRSRGINSKWFCAYPEKLDIIDCNFPDVREEFEKDASDYKL